MEKATGFQGFSKETVEFFKQLAKNNDKLWFNEHKREYETFVLEPAQTFVVDMGARLKKIAARIHAEPKVDKSIFRIYKDTRFSKDKRPFKTHLGLYFWEGPGKKMECPGYYFHLEPPNLMLASGSYMFGKEQLEEYRKSVVDPVHGKALAKIVKDIEKKEIYSIGNRHYKKIPHGFDPNHKNADFLLYDGLYAMYETRIPKEFYTAALLEYCYSKWNDMRQLHNWLVKFAERASR